MRSVDQRPRVGDETFTVTLGSGHTFGFNVTYAVREIIRDRPPTVTVPVDAFLCTVARINKKHLKTRRVRRDDPVILGTLPAPFNIFALDGHHRALWRKNMGHTLMVAHLLTEKETYECCFTRSQIKAVKKIIKMCEWLHEDVRELGANVTVIRQA